MGLMKQIAACFMIAAIAITISQVDNSNVEACMSTAENIVLEDYSFEDIKTVSYKTVETIAGLKEKTMDAIKYTEATLESYRELEE
jgi:hypothetical protein